MANALAAGCAGGAQRHRQQNQASFCPQRTAPRRTRCLETRAQSNGLLGLIERTLGWGGKGGGVLVTSIESPARQQLLRELRSPQPDTDLIWEACTQLMEQRVPFVESQLGGGPFVAVFTLGRQAWQLWTRSGSQALQGSVTAAGDNQAWQDFDPGERTVVNFGQVLGSKVTVKVSGTYVAVDPQQRCPQLVAARIEGGVMNAWGLQIPLPIRGEGKVEVAYLDPDMRVFRGTNGSVTVQVRQDRMPELLGWSFEE